MQDVLYFRRKAETWPHHVHHTFNISRRKIVGQILPCIMMSYMCMLTYKGAMLQAPPIGFVHADSYPQVQPIVTVAIINFDC